MSIESVPQARHVEVVWAGAIGVDTPLVWSNVQACEIRVGTIGGNLVLLDGTGSIVTVPQSVITRCGGVLPGAWSQVTAAGSGCYDLLVYYP